MILFRESADEDTMTDVNVAGLDPKDPDTEDGTNSIADEVETNMQAAALEGATYFENGVEAVNEFCNSDEVRALVESRKMSNKTFVRIGKQDDLTRRAHMASLILAREHKDPLFNKLALNRVRERKLRGAIFKKYQSQSLRIAKVSQIKHIKAMKKMPALRFRFN